MYFILNFILNNKVIETKCCIMTIQFHPEKPLLIAGGGFTGEVFLWDL